MFITSFGEQNITYKCCSNFLIHLCTTRDILSVGNKPDGRYIEACGGIGANWFGQICGGYSWSGKTFYGVIKGGSGAGAGIGVTDGWQNTSDYMPEQPIYTIPPEKMPIIPAQPFNFPRF
ncbi:hypothetical protein [Acinetobacter haemolyticus]|uniref:Uncharacterized protein n=2 Tax=Acinetobacter haemolyticus TaxID=29430 RepID=A0A857IIM4_ACIHA|nr:hypothetical protein [Acinetobacter haemolyticus]QHI09757.1 hypothetical protein AhaeAN59_06415 [Acinetobacter haemolyticus]QHI13020.1 hypothetical protein AhaeAN43_06345 [Acinetobacter haemolyticus]